MSALALGEMSPTTLDELLPIATTSQVGLLALKLNDLLDTWGADYREPFDSAHSTIYCLTSAFTSPWLAMDALFVATKIWTWITAIDDGADMYFRDPATLDASVQRCREVLDGGRPDPNDQLAVCLAEIRDALAGYPLFDRLGPLWRDTVDRIMVAMQFERRASDVLFAGGPAPDMAEYLDHAGQTIGIPMYMVSLWAMMDANDLPADLTELLSALRHSSLATRLGNDIRSLARERDHGNLNALMLGMTQQDVTAAIREHVSECRRRLEPLGHLGSAIAMKRQTIWATSVYDRIDFRTPGAWDEQ